jgi:hypothetical protein
VVTGTAVGAGDALVEGTTTGAGGEEPACPEARDASSSGLSGEEPDGSADADPWAARSNRAPATSAAGVSADACAQATTSRAAAIPAHQ